MEKISPMKRCIAKWTKKDRVGYLFIFPAVLVLFVFTIIPLVISFIISLTNLDIFLACWGMNVSGMHSKIHFIMW